MITSPEERALYNEWVKTWDDYKKGTEEVMALSRKAAGKIPHEAHELNTQDGQQDRRSQADEILKKDIDLNNTGADKAAKDAADSYASAFIDARGRSSARPSSLGVGVGFYLVRDVSRGIASIVTADAGAGQGRPDRAGAASGREDRDRRHGGYPAGVQGSADRQEGRRRGRRASTPKPRSSAAAGSTASPAISNR